MCESLARWSSRSPKSTSACSPRDTRVEKPIRRAFAQSRTAVTSAPDCEMKAMSPASASVWAKLAFRPSRGVSRPMQFGPSRRNTCGRAASSMACFCAGLSPALITIAARVPSRPSSAISAANVAGGVQITARSGTVGSLPGRAKHSTPSSLPCLGLTGWIAPANPPARRLRQTVAPTLPARSEAPTTQIEVGSSRQSRWRTLMGRSLRGRCSRCLTQRKRHAAWCGEHRLRSSHPFIAGVSHV